MVHPSEKYRLEQRKSIQMSEMISEKDAATLKARHHAGTASALPSNQHWFFFEFASVQAALDYLNTPLVQSAGEVSATARNNGTVGMYTIYPPTAPLQAPQRWFFKDFSSPQAGLDYLNTPAVQSDGEVSATIRNNGTVRIFYIAPA
jgi:hypothetical protein